MTDTAFPALSRRFFLAGSAAAAGGLALGFDLPGAAAAPDAATPEINAWVVVRPDETVVIRIARSEMGQGTLTGLAQLVAEELGCDWARVTTEYPTRARTSPATAPGAISPPAAAAASANPTSPCARGARPPAPCWSRPPPRSGRFRPASAGSRRA